MTLAVGSYPVTATVTRPDGLTATRTINFEILGAGDLNLFLSPSTEVISANSASLQTGEFTLTPSAVVEATRASTTELTAESDLDLTLSSSIETSTTSNAALEVVGELNLNVSPSFEIAHSSVASIDIEADLELTLSAAREGLIAPSATTDLPVVLELVCAKSASKSGQATLSFSSANSSISVSCTLVSRSSNVRSDLSSLSWAWFDQIDPENFGAPVDTGQVETTDLNGLLEITIQGSSLQSGEQGTLVLKADDGSYGAYNLEAL